MANVESGNRENGNVNVDFNNSYNSRNINAEYNNGYNSKYIDDLDINRGNMNN